MSNLFRKAERKQARLRLALCGPAGGGKTYSALLIAKGIGGKVAMIDTENHSGELYSHLMNYDVATLGAPYTPDRYIELIKGAENSGYEILIIDSLSHGWAGEGGVLDIVDKAASASNSKNSYVAWRNVTPMHNKLVDAMLQSKMHIIVTIRSKTAYETTTNDKGKMEVKKLGLAPIQREGLDYEFTTVLDLSVDKHVSSSSKDRTGIFDGKYQIPSEDTGRQLLAWLEEGKSLENEAEEYIKEIQKSESLEELKSVFEQAWNSRCASDLNLKDKIFNAKEDAKLKLVKKSPSVIYAQEQMQMQ